MNNLHSIKLLQCIGALGCANVVTVLLQLKFCGKPHDLRTSPVVCTSLLFFPYILKMLCSPKPSSSRFELRCGGAMPNQTQHRSCRTQPRETKEEGTRYVCPAPSFAAN